MKDKQVNLEEIETSHTLGGTGEDRVQERGKWRGYTCYSTVEQDTIGSGHGEGVVVCSTLMESDTLQVFGLSEEDTRSGGQTRKNQRIIVFFYKR